MAKSTLKDDDKLPGEADGLLNSDEPMDPPVPLWLTVIQIVIPILAFITFFFLVYTGVSSIVESISSFIPGWYSLIVAIFVLFFELISFLAIMGVADPDSERAPKAIKWTVAIVLWLDSWKRAIIYSLAAIPIFMQKVQIYFGATTGLLLIVLAFCYFLFIFRFHIDGSCLHRRNQETQTLTGEDTGVDSEGRVMWSLKDDNQFRTQTRSLEVSLEHRAHEHELQLPMLPGWSVARLLTSSSTSGGTSDDDAINAANTAVKSQSAPNSTIDNGHNTFSQALYDSMMLNALLLQIDANRRQSTVQGLNQRNCVEFYQPSQNQQNSTTSQDRLLLAIADNCQPSQANLLSTVDNSRKSDTTSLLNALSSSFWPKTSALFQQPSTFLTIDSTPPLRPRKAAPRAVFSTLQRRGLERYFQQHKYISRTERRRISATLGLTDVQVKIWFQNRRMKWRQNSIAPDATDTTTHIGVHAMNSGHDMDSKNTQHLDISK